MKCKMQIIKPCAFDKVCSCCNLKADKFVSVPVRTIEERTSIMLCHECLTDMAELILETDEGI